MIEPVFALIFKFVFIFSFTIVGLSAELSKPSLHTHQTHIGYSTYQGPSDTQRKIDFEYAYFYKELLETQLRYSENSSKNQVVNNISLGADFFYEAPISPFIFYRDQERDFLGKKFQVKKVALGLSWLPKLLKNETQFPYQHKFSLASITDIDNETYLSFRYKLKATVKPYHFSLTYFRLSNGEIIHASTRYDLNRWFYLKYSYNYENAPYLNKITREFESIDYDESSLSLNFKFEFKR